MASLLAVLLVNATRAQMPPELDQASEPPPKVGFETMDVSAYRADPNFHFDYDLTSSLARLGGSFVYDFGVFGWPTGLSYLGASPNQVTLTWEGIPFDDPLTGRPRYDLLPTALLESPGRAHGARAKPTEVVTGLRPFSARGALTELHYQAGDNGLQRVTVLHAQQTDLTLGGHLGTLQATFGYGGAAETGEYPGSQLRRMRQLLLRARYDQRRWSVEGLYLHNQRRIGAHGGVIPGQIYQTVYNRLIAATQHENAIRREVRNDLSVKGRIRVFNEPLTIHLWRTGGRLRYTRPAADTTSADARRWGVRVRQTAQWGAHRIRLQILGSERDSHIALRDSIDWMTVGINAEVRGSIDQDLTMAGASVEALWRRAFYVSAFITDIVPALIATRGFGSHVGTLSSPSAGRVVQLGIGIRGRWKAVDGHLMVFTGQERQVTGYYGQRTDSIAVRISPGSLIRSGAAIDAGFRRSTRRGVYIVLSGLFLSLSGDVESARKAAVPQWSARARVGLRYTLFTGDLKADLSLRVRGWSEMTSRALHAPTGLLVLPEYDRLYPEEGFIPASTAVSVVAEAGIRTATLFVGYENVLSGTTLMAGNQIVPIYPLPELRLRFGVFWPIIN